ncbi:MAG: polymer-forming cytoskeletal protein [Halobacteriota archaeon]
MNRHHHLRRATVLAVVAFVVFAGVAGVVAAQPSQGIAPAQTGPAGTVVVDEGETSNGISTVAGTVVVRGTVDGDVNAVSGDVVVEETGTVTGNVNGAAGSLRIAGTVGGNVDFAGGNVVFERPARIGGDVNLGAGNVLIAGQIDGTVTVGADRITVGPSAVVAGDLRYDGALNLQEGATVEGSVIRDDSIGGGMGPAGWGTNWGIPGWVDTVYGFFANLLLGALLLALFPRFSNEVADAVEERTARSGGWGLLLLFGIPILLVAFAITIVGIPVALLGLMLYVLAIWVGVVYGEFAVGRYLLTRLGSEGKWKALLLGLFVFSLLGFIPIVGGIAAFLALLVGLGALGSGLRGRFAERRGDGEEGAETGDDGDPVNGDGPDSDAGADAAESR